MAFLQWPWFVYIGAVFKAKIPCLSNEFILFKYLAILGKKPIREVQSFWKITTVISIYSVQMVFDICMYIVNAVRDRFIHNFLKKSYRICLLMHFCTTGCRLHYIQWRSKEKKFERNNPNVVIAPDV